MPSLHLKYLCHIMVATGKMEEHYESKKDTLLDLILELDEKYPGLKEIFVPPDGFFNARTSVTLSRPGEPARGISDPGFKLKDGDVLILW